MWRVIAMRKAIWGRAVAGVVEGLKPFWTFRVRRVAPIVLYAVVCALIIYSSYLPDIGVALWSGYWVRGPVSSRLVWGIGSGLWLRPIQDGA